MGPQEKSPAGAMANIIVPVLRTKLGVTEKREPGKAMANISATISFKDMERGKKDIHTNALKARRLLHAVQRPPQAMAPMEILSVATKALGCGRYNSMLICSTFGTPNRRRKI